MQYGVKRGNSSRVKNTMKSQFRHPIGSSRRGTPLPIKATRQDAMETGPRKDREKRRSARIRRSQFASRGETNVISAGVATKSAARLSESAIVDVNHCRAEQVHRTQRAFGPVNRLLFARKLELQGSLGLGASSIFGGALMLRHCICIWFCF